MDLFTYMEFHAKLALHEQMKCDAKARPEAISLNSFLQSLLEKRSGQANGRGFMVSAQKVSG